MRFLRPGRSTTNSVWNLVAVCILLTDVCSIYAQATNPANTPTPAPATPTPISTPPPVTPIVDTTGSFPAVVNPGQTVMIPGSFDPQKPDVKAKLFSVGSADGIDPKEVKVVSPHQLAVILPDGLAPGRYYLKLVHAGVTELVPGELRVEPHAIELDSAHPTTAYRNANGSFDFEVIGRNFSAVPQDNQIVVSGRGPIIPENHRFADKKSCDAPANLPCLWVESTGKLHVVGYQAERYQGPVSFLVEVGSARSSEKQLTLSRMSETSVLVASVVAFLALGLIVYWLVAQGVKEQMIDGKRYSPFWSFFIDKQSNSYSLSKFQLLAFFSVFVFGYLYVFLCRWLVQWQFVLPDVPSTFAAVLAMSAGTTLVAAGATLSRGSKGSGPVTPSAADFISSGGQVIPERFQFFVWTLVACFGFVALLVSQDPATIQGFPTFPQGLLYVMGLSAGGYLGGKLARAPGPVIRNIAWDNPTRRLTVQGENLSSEADFFIDGEKLPLVPQANTKLVEGTPQEQQADRTFCSQLTITVRSEAGLDLSTGDHVFRIMNKDGQFADTRFTADPPRIADVWDDRTRPASPPAAAPAASPPAAEFRRITSGQAESRITVTGVGFRPQMIARWTPANATDPVDLAASAVDTSNLKALKLTLVPGPVGTGTLLLITPSGYSTTATVEVL